MSKQLRNAANDKELQEQLHADAKTKDVEEREERMRNSGIEGSITDEDWRLVKLNSLHHSKSLEFVEGWLEQRTLYLALLGTVGCGKTLACAYAIAEVGGLYTTAKRVERVFLAQFGTALAEQEHIMNKNGLLVIDDVGTELNQQTFASSLFEVLNARQGAGRRTILTANMPKKDFEQRYTDARLLSRLKRADVVGYTDEDRRKK